MYSHLWGVTFMSDFEVTVQPSGVSLVWSLDVRLVFLLVSVERSLASLSLASATRPWIYLAPSSWRLCATDYYLLCFYSHVTQYPQLGPSWLPPVASQRFQALVPSFAPVGLLCGGLSTRFLYNLGLKHYHHIKYNYLTVLLYYPIAPRASPVIV